MNVDGVKEYRPELIPSRGEATAWGLTVLLLATWLILALLEQPALAAARILAIVLLVFSLGISLSNWMDRRTTLRIAPQGVEFANGLRHVRLAWDEVRQVRAFVSP